MPVRALLGHLVAAVVIGVVLTALTLFGVQQVAADNARRSAELVARHTAEAVLVPMSEHDFTRPADRVDLMADLAPFLRTGLVARVKVFTVDSSSAARIAFSDDATDDGIIERIPQPMLDVLDRGDAFVQPMPHDAAHVNEQNLPGELYEVFFSFRDAGGHDSLLEIYVPVTATETAHDAVVTLVPIVLGGVVLVALATAPLSVSATRRAARIRAEQQAVRRYGLAAAELARRDVAQRLHDGVIPDLAGTSALLSAARSTAPDPLLDRARDVIEGDVAHLRSLLDELTPAPLEDLAGAVERIAASLGPDRPAVTVEVCADVPADLAVVIHRIAAELLRNATRHANASRVRVTVDGPPVRLLVSDDGSGFDPAAPRRAGHVGLQLVRQVVEDNDGEFRLVSRPGQGTEVTARFERRPR
jgi:two-component system, NarL family, sensor kinase